MAAPIEPRQAPLAALLHEYRPSVVTGGASAVPLLVLAAINMADEFDRVAFGLLLPEIQDWFGVSLTTILTVSAVAGLLPILLAAPIGFLADRWRRTTMVAAGTGLWGTFSILTAFAPSLPLLGAARLGSGLGKTLDPVHASLLSDHYPPRRRAGVFALHRFGNELGQMIAPLAAGLLASAFFWQLPFLVFGLPAFVLAVVVLTRLREPVRGAQERAAAGLGQEPAGAADEAEPPPGWSESWRAAKGVRTLRRIWMALPFLVGSFLGVAALMSVYYDQEFGLGSAGRGGVFALVQACNVVGLLVGGSVGNRLLARRASRVVSLAGVMALIPAACFALIAVSPWLVLSIALQCVGALALPFFAPATSALISLVVPARVRGFAFAVGAVFVAPGCSWPPWPVPSATPTACAPACSC